VKYPRIPYLKILVRENEMFLGAEVGDEIYNSEGREGRLKNFGEGRKVAGNE